MKTPDGGSRRWLSPVGFAVVLGLLLAIAWGSVFQGGRLLYWRDFGSLAYPVAAWHRASLWAGELPLWNPWSHCGVPFLAQWNTLVLYPGSLLYVLGPLNAGLMAFCVVHMGLGGLGMYFLVRAWSGERREEENDHGLGAGLGGVAYAFGGGMIASHIYPNYLVALGWMPWVLWLAVRAVSGRPGSCLIAGVVAALQLLSGAPEIVLMTWLMAVAVGLGESAQGGVFRRMCRLALAAAVAAGLAAAQLLPFFGLASEAQRGAGYSSVHWGLPSWGWVNLLLPLFRCSPGPDGILASAGQSFLMSWHVSGATVVFSLASVLVGRAQRASRVVAGLIVMSVVLSSNGAEPIRHGLTAALPVEGWFRYPIKWIYMAVMGFPLLAGLGVSGLGSAGAGQRQRAGVWCCVAAAVVVGVLVMAQRTESAGAAGRGSASGEGIWLAVVMGSVALALGGRSPGIRLLGLVVALGALWADLWLGSARWAPAVDAPAVTGSLGASVPRPGLGKGRVMISPRAEALLQRRALPEAELDVLGARLALWSNWNLVERVPKVNGASTLRPRGQAQIEHDLYQDGANAAAPLLRFLGVTHVSDPANPTDWVSVDGAMPWVTGGQTPVFGEEAAAIKAVSSPDFRPESVVYLPEEAAAFEGRCRGDVTVSDVVVDAQQVSFRAKAESAGWVVIAQTWGSGWRARVDGKAVRLWRANGAFQALAVPAGEHGVELFYRETLFQFGCGISGLTGVTCLVAWWRGRRRQRAKSG